MRKIIFANQTISNYFLGRGRGKDKKKRKSRTLISDAKDILNRYQSRNDRSSVATKSTAALGAALGASQAAKLGMNPTTGALIGAFNVASIGMSADRQIAKEKGRYRKEGPRTRLGKIVNDAKVGARSTAGFLALDEAFKTGSRQFQKQLAVPYQKFSGKKMLIRTGGAALGGALVGALKGTAIGAGIGSGVGTVRGFVQPNKKKKDKK